jgi:hypothetical protein
MKNAASLTVYTGFSAYSREGNSVGGRRRLDFGLWRQARHPGFRTLAVLLLWLYMAEFSLHLKRALNLFHIKLHKTLAILKRGATMGTSGKQRACRTTEKRP